MYSFAKLKHLLSTYLLFPYANASLIQAEINTHLHVLHISLTTNYNSAVDSGAALDTMTAKFGRSSSVGWHYTSRLGSSLICTTRSLARDWAVASPIAV